MEHLNICYPLLILFLLTSCEPSARHQEHDGGIRRYSALLQAIDDNNYGLFLLGQQKVKANVSHFNKDFGKHNTFRPEKLINQFDYIDVGGRLPEEKKGLASAGVD